MFIEHDVTRGENAASRGIKAPIALGVVWVTDEHARHRTWCEFVRSRHVGVGETSTAENTKMIVFRVLAEQEKKGGSMNTRCARSSVDEISGCVQRIRPEGKGHGSVQKHGADAIVEGAKNAFRTAVLLRRVGAG